MKEKPGEKATLERRFVAAGTIIVREGDYGGTAFLIQSGKVAIYAGTGGKRVDLAVLGPGEIFGEMALVADDTRSATAEAVEDCRLVVITRMMLQQKLEKSDPTVRAIVPMLMKRIMSTNETLVQRRSTLDTMVETVQTIYQNVHSGAPPVQKKALESSVLPPLEAFLAAVKAYRRRYKE